MKRAVGLRSVTEIEVDDDHPHRTVDVLISPRRRLLGVKYLQEALDGIVVAPKHFLLIASRELARF
jgi:hypothetical protein